MLRIINATALCMDDCATVLRDAVIRVEGDRIVAVEAAASSPVPVEGEAIIDGAGMVAIPGLVNAHTHLAMTLFRGAADDLPLMTWLEEKIWPVERRLRPEDVYWASLLGVAEMFLAGVTTFSDMYWHPDMVVRAVRESGIRARISGVVFADRGLAEAMELAQGLMAEGHPRMLPMFGPHAPYTVPPAMMRKVIDAAGALGVPVHTHLSETAGEVAACRAEHGMGPIALMRDLGLFEVPVAAAHCVCPEPDEIAMLAEGRVGVVHCPRSNMKLGSGIAPVPAYLAAGVAVGLGTDGAGSNNTLSVLGDLQTAALLHKVGGDPTALPAHAALSLATRGGARALCLPDVGALVPGMAADIVLLDFDAPHLAPAHGREVSHLVYAAQAADVRTVLVAGQVVVRDRQCLTLDLPRIRAHVDESAARLFG